MARTQKYKTADDLINNCTTQGMCIVWPVNDFVNNPNASPVISPYSPLTKTMLTNSVTRILFITCRYIPASRRLVKWCNTPHCVNPYHHSENQAVVARRFALAGKEGKAHSFFTDLLPEQEKMRDYLPKPEDIEAARPMELDVLKLLQESAMLSGVDGRGLSPALRQHKELPDEKAPDFKPILQMSGVTKKLVEERGQVSDDDVDSLFNNDIFRQIEERKRRMLAKTVDEWDLDQK